MTSTRHEVVIEASGAKDCTKGTNINLTPLTPQMDVENLFGQDIFDLKAMRKRLPQDVYKSMEKVINKGERLTEEVASIVANAMKDWAVEHGATHYTHWFHPMTGCTAEKHDSLFTPTSDGTLISKFSGKTLICGEPDASSFPSGGIRSTFEARGYTAWDPTVPAFLMPGKNSHTLNIPTVFYSYSGEALDRKTPLLRSIEVLSKKALRVLKLFGNEEVTSVRPMVGAEQEYFLVDARLAALRPDLLLTGRTLLGAPSPKGQEMEDHYFGAIPKRVMGYMQDVEARLFALGIPAHTRHNEVAPGQFELAPLYEEANIATDHNMLIMNTLKEVAHEHGFICLLHEKPFAGVNGSGKHNNWSLGDSEGHNLLDPGITPLKNAQFLVFLGAVLKAVHEHSNVLRLGTIGAGNDHRLGANEAPPAIISVYLGELLTNVLESIIAGRDSVNSHSGSMEIGVSSLPLLPRDYSDRNRTSPFAFTGNKFEFRAVGSSQSVAPVNIALNTATACALEDIANDLEALLAKNNNDISKALQSYLPELFKKHMPVVFNGNGYSAEWKVEAEKRGLFNLENTVSALKMYSSKPVMDAFTRFNILSEREILARKEILLETYSKTIIIEGQVLANIIKERVLPVCQKEQTSIANLAIATKQIVGEASVEETLFKKIRGHVLALISDVNKLEVALEKVRAVEEAEHQAEAALNEIVPLMLSCRTHTDTLEEMVDDSMWLLPKYQELLWIN